MEHNSIVHTYTKPPRETFWRIGYVIVLVAGAFVGAALALAPVYYFLKYQNAWIAISFLFIPLGIWIAYRTLRHLQKLIWEDSHLSSYNLYENKIEAEEWVEAYSQAPVKREIPLNEVTSVTASFYILRKTMTMLGPTHQTITETAPILYIRYTKNGQENVLNLEFPNHGDDNINVWLSHFQQRNIPLLYTARLLYRVDTQSYNDQQRLEYFKSSGEVVEFPFSGSWLKDEAAIRPSWNENESTLRAEEEEKDPELKKACQKHNFKFWIWTVWLAAMVIILSTFAYTKFGSFLPLSSGNIIPGLLIFTFGGFLFFFCLRSYLRWFYMFTYLALVLITGFWIGVLSDSLPAIEAELAISISMASLLYPLLVWIPYVTIKKMTNKKATAKFSAA